MRKRRDSRKPRVSSEALWLWGTLRDFETDGFLRPGAAADMRNETMPLRMAQDIIRLAPKVRAKLEELLVEIEAESLQGSA